ncbi:hypothetical protein J6590_020599 [Homalodisca vitripennis]|nr:hypothetical protein J6590_020599 [Homalodisca vitripennis]
MAVTQDNQVKEHRVWLVLTWVSEISCSCKQPAAPPLLVTVTAAYLRGRLAVGGCIHHGACLLPYWAHIKIHESRY